MRLGKIRSRFFLTTLLISILLSAVSITVYHTDALSFVFGAAGMIATPFQKAAEFVTDSFSSLSARFADIDRLQKENERLKEENARLLSENRESLVIKEENTWLKQFLDLKTERTELSFVNAKIVARDVGYIRTFTLDKGSFHGLAVNMPVITENGLLGIVTEVGPNTARGISILNHNVRVGVYMERTMTSAVLSGSFTLYESGLCKVINLPADADVLVGDLVYTSGYGSLYPKDIVVGTVVSIEPDPEYYTISAIVQPSADMSLSDYVMVVTDSTSVYE